MGRLSDEVLGDLIARQSRVIIIADGNDKDLMEYTENILKFLKELQEYRSICDSPEKLKLIDALYIERCEEINRLNAELAKYKKLEEQGLLAKLPCKIGDVVYQASKFWNKFLERTVACIVLSSDNHIYVRNGCGDSFEFGVDVFLTQEEAEQALERMKGDS